MPGARAQEEAAGEGGGGVAPRSFDGYVAAVALSVAAMFVIGKTARRS
jgi:hypothetical protein